MISKCNNIHETLSPYLRIIDPNGTDIWEVDDLGNILSHIVDKTPDTFYKMSKDDKGNYYRSGCISFAYRTIEKQKTIKTAKGSYDIY